MEIAYHPLENRFVRLEPFTPALKEGVRLAIDCDEGTWEMMPATPMGEHFDAYWEDASARLDIRLPFAIRRRSDGRIIGTSSYYLDHMSEGGIEIGSTFLHPDVRAGVTNPAAKLLLLDHAFASGAVRVQFRVDTRNERSRAAMTKLGAVNEGILRRNRLTWTGYIRDTMMFSILDREWPTVRERLERRLAAY